MFKDKTVLIIGGTGSLGKAFVSRILSGSQAKPKKIIIFSRDEAKQHNLRLKYRQIKAATDEILYDDYDQIIQFVIGDVRNYHSVLSALRGVDIVVYTAALKQVPSCEYFPFEAVKTNIIGAENVIRAINQFNLPVETVVGVSTDKACKPVNVMGMTKAIQERLWVRANLHNKKTKFVSVRYGNVLASRGSVVPLFHHLIKSNSPLTITSKEMTRFLMSLDNAVDLVFEAIKSAKPGETYIPVVPSANIVDIASVLIGDRKIDQKIIGIRPGEKTHEILISEEEIYRTSKRGKYLVIHPMLPELYSKKVIPLKKEEYGSKDNVVSKSEVKKIFEKHSLLIEQQPEFDEDTII